MRLACRGSIIINRSKDARTGAGKIQSLEEEVEETGSLCQILLCSATIFRGCFLALRFKQTVPFLGNSPIEVATHRQATTEKPIHALVGIALQFEAVLHASGLERG